MNDVIDLSCRLPSMNADAPGANRLFDAFLPAGKCNGDAEVLDRAEGWHRQSCGTESFWFTEHEAPLGSHVVTPRRGYLHHGIYVGGGKVVHYAGLAQGLRRGPVEEISLVHFTRGRPVWIRSAPASFDSPEVIRRARSRVGEDSYRLFTNNCEHFCEWCLRGEPRSYQIEAWLTPLFQLAARIGLGGVKYSRLARVCPEQEWLS